MSPVFDLLTKSIKLVFKTYEQVAYLVLVPILLSDLGAQQIGKLSLKHLVIGPHQIIGFVLFGIWILLNIINYPATVYLKVQSSKNKSIPGVIECYKQSKSSIVKIWLVTIISFLAIGIGLALFIVPGILLFRRLIMSPYFVVDNPKLGIKEIFKKSINYTNDYTFYVYAAYGLSFLITIILFLSLNNSTIGNLIFVLLNFSVLYIPVIRYQEIVKANKKRAGSTRNA